MQTTEKTLSQKTFDTTTLDERKEFDRSRPLERDETTFLISSGKVEGTDVFATDGEKIGTIDHLMLGKRSGRVEYAVMSFGGFLGIGESFAPLPWETLDYDPERGGYVVNIDKSLLKDAPRFERDSEPAWDTAYGQHVYSYYGVMY
ncbi:PRC-barrel domain-containing protein [Parasphingorhabdus sp. JC815]|uniref:PRC-barrel domain-containing protein n=1 Tax=Parasphingorhabdus sp. JC815 TaxID=3232140 RepID=UPI003459C6B1